MNQQDYKEIAKIIGVFETTFQKQIYFKSLCN